MVCEFMSKGSLVREKNLMEPKGSAGKIRGRECESGIRGGEPMDKGDGEVAPWEVGAKAEAVAAVGPDMEFGGDAVVVEAFGEEGGIGGGDGGILKGVPEEAGGSGGGDLKLAGEVVEGWGVGFRAEEGVDGALVGVGPGEGNDRIAENAEVGAHGERVKALVKGEEACGEVAAGGGTDDADAGGINAPFGSCRAHRVDCGGGIFEHGRVAVALGAEAVAGNKSIDAVCGEEAGIILALVGSEFVIAAAGENDDGGAVGCFRGGEMG